MPRWISNGAIACGAVPLVAVNLFYTVPMVRSHPDWFNDGGQAWSYVVIASVLVFGAGLAIGCIVFPPPPTDDE